MTYAKLIKRNKISFFFLILTFYLFSFLIISYEVCMISELNEINQN